jgi:hypothetical protein
MTPHQHFCALTDKLAKLTAIAGATYKGRRLITLLQSKIEDILHPLALAHKPQVEQRVREEEQRVIDETPILTIPRITDAPPIMQVRNPTSKRVLKSTPRIHRRSTWNNILVGVPLIRRLHPIPGGDTPEQLPMMIIAPPSQRHLLRTHQEPMTLPTTRWPLPLQGTQCILMRQVMNVLTIKEKATFNAMFTPHDLMQHAVLPFAHHFKHYANPMVHPMTGETISSCKKLMHNPTSADIWQTAFGKDFGGMAQGDNKMGQKGINAMFVMTHEEIQHVLRAGKKITYTNPVVDHCPQKEDANRIQITAGGNLINYNEELSVPTADLVTEKLHEQHREHRVGKVHVH